MSVSLAIDDPYLLLGVPRDADDRVLKVAFRKRARELHPDVCREPGTEERFASVTRAYRRLADQGERQLIDADIDAWQRFLGARPGPYVAAQAGADLTVPLRMTAAEVAAGGLREVCVEVLAECDLCQGTGLPAGHDGAPCQDCEGSGHRVHVQQTLSGDRRSWRPCLGCEARGRRTHDQCAGCSGQGLVRRQVTLTVRVPAGLEDGTLLLLRGRGHAGRHGGEPGDLSLELVVSDRPLAMTESGTAGPAGRRRRVACPA